MALAHMEKVDQQIRKEAKTWMQKNVFSYANKVSNMPVPEAIQLQRVLENLPDCLDVEDLTTVDNYRSQISERIKMARVEAIELMFKELGLDEKKLCLNKLRKIMGEG